MFAAFFLQTIVHLWTYDYTIVKFNNGVFKFVFLKRIVEQERVV